MTQGTEKKPKRRKMKEAEAIETEPDAWERFEKTIGKIVPPKRRLSKEDGEAKETDK